MKINVSFSLRSCFIKPPRGELIYFKPIWRGSLIETGGLIWEGGGLFNLETTIVSVLHKELEYKVERLKYKKWLGHAAEGQNQIRTKPSQVSPREVLQSWLVNAVSHLLANNNLGEGRGGLLTFFPWKGGAY